MCVILKLTWLAYRWEVENLHYIVLLSLNIHPSDRDWLDFLYKEAKVTLMLREKEYSDYH